MAELYGGSMDLGDLTPSIAQEIEDAFEVLWIQAGLGPLPADIEDEGWRSRRMLFAAIGRGILAHLKQQEAAFWIGHDHGFPGFPTNPANPTIQVKNP